jgi:hypothetical protein
MKCQLCEQRKAKRPCPARNDSICAQCCGAKRVLEINCPETCVFLMTGREREVQDYAKRCRVLARDSVETNQRLFNEHQDTIARIEYALARERLSDRNLRDRDVADAIGILLEAYRTEDKGVLYEKTSEDLRVEALRRTLRTTVEALRNPGKQDNRGIVDAKTEHLPLSIAIGCLGIVQSIAASYIADRVSDSGYVDFLARIYPREEKRGNSILMP